MKKKEQSLKLLVAVSCWAAAAIAMLLMICIFHCPVGWKAWIWLGMVAISLLLLWPVKRYTRTIPLLIALLLSVAFLCCTYVEPYFLKEADFTQGSTLAKENVWIAVWFLMAIGLCYLMVHLVTKMMDHLSPNEAVFDAKAYRATPTTAASPKETALLSAILAVMVAGIGIFSVFQYKEHLALIPQRAAYSEADYTIVMPNFKADHDDDATLNVVIYGEDHRVGYRALPYISENEFVSAAYEGSEALILRHRDYTVDVSQEWDILSMTFKESYQLYNSPPSALPEADKPLLTAILKGGDGLTPVALSDAVYHGYVKVVFAQQEHLWWEAGVMEKDGSYYLRVATNTDFSDKEKPYDPMYVYYPLSQSYA